MDVKPIFVIYLPVGSMEPQNVSRFVEQCMENVKSEIHGWSVLIAPTRISEEIKFEAFHVNNLKPVDQQQISKIQKTVESFIESNK